jgi:GNAT superfamily N-acetyltransferase
MTPPTTGPAVRRADAGDREALAAMVDRCSADAIYRRFHGAPGPYVRRALDRISTPTDDHRSWVAAGDDGAIHGTATLAWGHGDLVEVAVLVEDAWRRRGLGRALMAAVAAEAARAGVGTVTATVQADNTGAVDFARALVPTVPARYLGGTDLEFVVPVAPRSQGAAPPADVRSARPGVRTPAGPRRTGRPGTGTAAHGREAA